MMQNELNLFILLLSNKQFNALILVSINFLTFFFCLFRIPPETCVIILKIKIEPKKEIKYKKRVLCDPVKKYKI